MTDTTNLGLPCIEGGQAQKHVTHNEALRILDTLVQLAVDDRDLAVPPASPADGDRYIVHSGATGAWAGHVDEIAAWQDGAWQFSVPRLGWLAYVIDESLLVAWNGSAWMSAIAALTPTALNNMSLLGIGTTADAANPFSAKLNNALFAAKTAGDGGSGDLRLKLSKEAAANTLSLLFQSGYSGRAELGLTGDDNFHLKVSADGSVWTEAMTIDRATGSVSLPNSPWASRGMSFLNKFRNASLDIWQRGASGTVTAGAPSYTADGWIAGCTGANIAWSRQSGRLFSAYSLRLTGAASVTDVFVRQRIESFLCCPLAGLPVMVQGRVYNNTGGSITPTITVKRAGATDDWASPTVDVNAVSLQPCADGAWTQVSYVFTANAGAGVGLEVTLGFGNNFGAGTKYVQICEMDIGVGNLLRLPDLRGAAYEAMDARRYLRTVVGDAVYYGTGYCTSATGAYFPSFGVPMRAAPSSPVFSSAGHFVIYPHAVAVTNLSLNAANSANVPGINAIVASGLSSKEACMLASSSASASLILSAEL